MRSVGEKFHLLALSRGKRASVTIEAVRENRFVTLTITDDASRKSITFSEAEYAELAKFLAESSEWYSQYA